MVTKILEFPPSAIDITYYPGKVIAIESTPLEHICTDGGTQPRASLDQDKIAEYAQLMLDGVVFDPVIVYYDGTNNYWLADGFHRYHAAKHIGKEEIDTEIRFGYWRDAVLCAVEANTRHGIPLPLADRKRCAKVLLEDEEWSQWSDREIARRCGIDGKTVATMRPKKNAELPQSDIEPPVKPVEEVEEVRSKRTTNEEKRKTVEDFIADTPDWQQKSNREIARICGVSESLVRTIRTELEPEPKPIPESEEEVEPTQTLVDSTAHVDNPSTYVDNTPTPESESEPTLEPEVEPEPIAEEKVEPEPVVSEPIEKSATLTALQSSESNEWYTPAIYVNAARKLMGGIDLDPASCKEANGTVKAARYYDITDNGLTQEWEAKTVWLNPPYGKDNGKSNQEAWTKHLIKQFEEKNVEEAVLLVNSCTGASWFQPLFNHIICFTDHRIRFYNAESDQPTKENALIYFGPEHKYQQFKKLFSQFGHIGTFERMQADE